MALWAKAQQLPPDSIHFQQIRGIYGDHFPIEVRHYLAQFIEEKFWSNIDPVPENEQYVGSLVNQLIQEIENKAEGSTENSEYFLTKLKLAEAAKLFRERYSSNPLQLFNFIRQCLATEMKFLQAAGADFVGMGPTLPLSNAATEILHKLDNLRRRTQITAEDARKLEQDQEAFALQYHECTKVNATLQQLNNQTTPQEQQAIQSYIKRKDMLEADLNRRVAALMELRIKLTEQFKQTYQLLHQVQSQIIDEELIRWKRDQQLAGNGVPFNSNLDQIQDWCEGLAEIIWHTRQHIKEVERLKQKLAIDPPGVVDVLPSILAEITQLLSSLVTSTFIIEKQPPQVMKTNTRFTATVRLLVGGKLNVHMNPPQVKVSIISESQANLLLKNDKLVKGSDSSGEILNNTGTMEYQQTTRQLSVSFRNMQLKKIKRAEKKGTESVMDEKFSLFFQSQFSVGGGELMFQYIVLGICFTYASGINTDEQWENSIQEMLKNIQLTSEIRTATNPVLQKALDITFVQTIIDNVFAVISRIVSTVVPDINVPSFLQSIVSPVLILFNTLAGLTIIQAIPQVYIPVIVIQTVLTVANVTIGVLNFTTTNITTTIIAGVQTIVDSILNLVAGIIP